MHFVQTADPTLHLVLRWLITVGVSPAFSFIT